MDQDNLNKKPLENTTEDAVSQNPPVSNASKLESLKAEVKEMGKSEENLSAAPENKTEDYPFHDFGGEEETEEFTYKPKPILEFKKIAKYVLVFLSLTLLVAVLVYLLPKLKTKEKAKVVTKGEVTWWGIGLSKEVVDPLIEDYQGANPGTKITYIEESPIDYRERLFNSIAQGKGPDIFMFHNSWVPMLRKNLGFLPQKIISQDEYVNMFYPVIVKDMTTPEGIVGIPLEYDAITLLINNDIFSTAGKIPPRTWDQFRQLAVDLTTKGDRGVLLQSGSAMGLTANVDYWPEIVALLMLQDKASLIKPTGSSAEEAISYYTGYASAGLWNYTLPQSTEAFAEGKVAMIFSPVRAVDSIRKINPNINFRTVTVPQIRRDDPTEPDITYATYWVQGVSSKSNNSELAWDLLRFLSTKESLEKIYKNSQDAGLTGEPYPRIEMRDTLINNSVLGSVLALAPNAVSGYLADKTNDGEDGINSSLNKAYQIGLDSLVGVTERKNAKTLVPIIAGEAAKVYLKYGITQ